LRALTATCTVWPLVSPLTATLQFEPEQAAASTSTVREPAVTW
jgi:hypothetical protein